MAGFERLDRFVGATGRVERHRVDVGVTRVGRIDHGGAGQFRQGIGGAPLADQVEAQRMMQFGVTGHPCQRLAQGALAIGVAALLRIKLGKADIDRREARVEGAGGGVFRFGFGQSSLPRVQVAEVEPVLGAIGVDPLRRHVVVDGTRQPVPIVRRQTILRHRGEQRGGFDPDAQHRIGEKAAGQWPALLYRERTQRAQRRQPDQRVGVSETPLGRRQRFAAGMQGQALERGGARDRRSIGAGGELQ